MVIHIGKRIKELRTDAKITQKRLGEMLNKSSTAVASWEQGLSEPCVNDLRLLCSIFDVSADYLLGLEN